MKPGTRKLEITIVPRQVGELWDELLEEVLRDIARPPVEHKNVTNPHQVLSAFYNKNYNVNQGKCYHQYTPNLCGYHAIFNTLCFLNILDRGESKYQIQSGASFWSFKKKIEKFLLEIKQANKLKNQWPWREDDIKYGDFERTYNNICLEMFDDFQIFKNHANFELHSFTWEFQYQNLIVSDDKKRELNKLIDYFKSYKNTKPLVISFMLGITNHWTCLIAIKNKNGSEYWFFDSKNKHVLDLNGEQIKKFVEELNQQKLKYKKEQIAHYYREIIQTGIRDTQISLKLIIDCLEGRNSIDSYVYNQQFNVFAKHLMKSINHTSQFQSYIKDYWINIYGFFRRSMKWNILSKQSLGNLIQIAQKCNSIRHNSQYGQNMYYYLPKDLHNRRLVSKM